jgi:hypothetical protein
MLDFQVLEFTPSRCQLLLQLVNLRAGGRRKIGFGYF